MPRYRIPVGVGLPESGYIVEDTAGPPMPSPGRVPSRPLPNYAAPLVETDRKRIDGWISEATSGRPRPTHTSRDPAPVERCPDGGWT